MSDRHIPEDVKRTVRQRCAFGCVVCGLPVYHYDHMEEFAVVRSHDAGNIVLLCPTHHNEKTVGRLSKAAVQQAAANPHNKGQSGTSAHRWILVGDHCVFNVGGNRYEVDFATCGPRFDAIVIKGQTVLGMEHIDGALLLNVLLTDRTGSVILQIEKGEMVVSTGVWDYRLEGPLMRIRRAEGQIELSLTFDEHGVTVRKGFFVMPPLALVVEPDHHTILPNRITMSGCTTRNCRTGLHVS